jgi:TRAP-type C4-dicarboxylate transport system permease small subunit
VERFLERLGRLGELLICLFMASLVGLGFTQVVLRYAFNRSFFWAEEVILFAFTWLIFVASAVNLERGAHFGMDVLVNLLPEAGRRTIQVITQVIAGVILAVFIGAGFRFAAGAWVEESEILRQPMTYLYLALPVSASVMFLVVLRNLVRLLSGRPLKVEVEDL